MNSERRSSHVKLDFLVTTVGSLQQFEDEIMIDNFIICNIMVIILITVNSTRVFCK